MRRHVIDKNKAFMHAYMCACTYMYNIVCGNTYVVLLFPYSLFDLVWKATNITLTLLLLWFLWTFSGCSNSLIVNTSCNSGMVLHNCMVIWSRGEVRLFSDLFTRNFSWKQLLASLDESFHNLYSSVCVLLMSSSMTQSHSSAKTLTRGCVALKFSQCFPKQKSAMLWAW